jgi:hypothetical protein
MFDKILKHNTNYVKLIRKIKERTDTNDGCFNILSNIDHSIIVHFI